MRLNNIRKFIHRGYEVEDRGMHFAIPELKNYFLHSMRDVDFYIDMTERRKQLTA